MKMIYLGDLWFALNNLWGEGGRITLGNDEVTPEEILEGLDWLVSTKDGFTSDDANQIDYPINVCLKDNPLKDKDAFKKKSVIISRIQESLGDNIALAGKYNNPVTSDTDRGFQIITMPQDVYGENTDLFSDVYNIDAKELNEKLTLSKDYSYSPHFSCTPLIHIASLSGYIGGEVDEYEYTINTDVDEDIIRKLKEATLKARCVLAGEDFDELSHILD